MERIQSEISLEKSTLLRRNRGSKMAARQATAGNLKRFERSGVGSRRRGKEEGKHVRGEKTKERKISISRTRKREREIHTQEENKEGDAIDQENFRETGQVEVCVWLFSLVSRKRHHNREEF